MGYYGGGDGYVYGEGRGKGAKNKVEENKRI